MRRNHIILAVLASAVGLAVWFWSGSTKNEKEDTSTPESSIEARKSARQSGKVNTSPASVSGLIIDATSQEPIEGATISLALRRFDGGVYGKAGESQAPLVARSNAQGRFTISGLAPGNYSLSSAARNYSPQYLDGIHLSGGQKRDDIRFQLTRGGHLLTGVISDIGGGPVSYALVRARKFSDFTIGSFFRAPFTTTSDADGNYELNLGDGNYRVEVFHADYRKEQNRVIIGGQDRSVDFVLTPGSVIEGVVLRQSDDKPIPRATVSFNKMGQTNGFTVSGIAFNGGAETDDEGRFTLRGLGSGAFELRAVAKNASSRQPTVVELAIAESLSDITIYVDEAYTISGFVVDSSDDSGPESDVMVGAYNLSPGAVFASTSPSASDGYFEIHGVHPGDYTVGAAREERQPNFFGESVTVTDENIEGIVVKIDAGNTITGRVEPPVVAKLTLAVEAENFGFSSVLQSAGALLVNSKSDENGLFELKGVGSGTFTIVATTDSGSEGRQEVVVDGDQDNIIVALEERASISGIVVNSQGRPVEGVTVDFSEQSSNRRDFISLNGAGMVTMSGPDGAFHRSGLDDGVYDITVKDKGQIPWANTDEKSHLEPVVVTIEEGQDKRDLRLAVETRDHKITGTVRGPEGDPLADAWVTAQFIRKDWLSDGKDEKRSAEDRQERRRQQRRWSPRESPVLTDADGRFAIKKLRSGKYNLSAEGLRGSALGTMDEVAVDSDVTIKIAALGKLSGRVSKGGGPVNDYVITATGPTRRRVHVARDDGKFTLPRLEPGDYRINIAATEGVATAQATIQTGKDENLEIQLATFGSVTGVLLDAKTGEPIADVSVMATMGQNGSDWANNAMKLMTNTGPKTDEEGRFRVGKLGAGKGSALFFDAEMKGFEFIAREEFELEAGEDLDLGEISGTIPTKIAEEERGDYGFQTDFETHKDSFCADTDPPAEAEDSEFLWVASIVPGGAADKAGIKRCDRITTIQPEGGMLLSAQQLGKQATLFFHNSPRIGDKVTLGLISDGTPTTVTVTAQAASDDESEQ